MIATTIENRESQSRVSAITNPVPQKSKLVAQWIIENGKLVCKWVIS